VGCRCLDWTVRGTDPDDRLNTAIRPPATLGQCDDRMDPSLG